MDALNNVEKREVESLLPEFVNGTLDSDKRSVVLSHLANCDACIDRLFALRVLQTAVRDFVASTGYPDKQPQDCNPPSG